LAIATTDAATSIPVSEQGINLVMRGIIRIPAREISAVATA
jgi:hypothetical protein